MSTSDLLNKDSCILDRSHSHHISKLVVRCIVRLNVLFEFVLQSHTQENHERRMRRKHGVMNVRLHNSLHRS